MKNYFFFLKHLFWLLLCLAFHLALAQAPVLVIPQITPPYSPHLADYSDKVIVTITNTTGTPRQLKLFGNMTGDNGISVFTNPNFHPDAPIELAAFETKTFTPGPGNQDFFDTENIQYNVSYQQQQSILIQGLIPGGNYQYCVKAVDYNTGDDLSDPAPVGCNDFAVGLSSPPFPTMPACEEPLWDVSAPTFSWTAPDGLMPGANLVYDLYLVKVLPNDDPVFTLQQAVINGQGNPFVVTNLTMPLYMYQPSDPPLSVQTKYVWGVVVRDLGNVMMFENDGLSTACTFDWKPWGENGTPPFTYCDNDCQFEGLNTQDLIDDPYAALASNDRFKMGDFEIKVYDLLPVNPNTPNVVSGNGFMNVPLIGFNYKIRIRVQFVNVILNIDRQAVQGVAFARSHPDAATLIPNYDTDGWDGVDMGSANLWNLDTWIKQQASDAYDAAKLAVESYGLEVPMGITVGGVSAAVTRLRFEPTFATMSMVALVNLNQFDPSLPPTGIGVSNLCISADGPCKEFKLYLPQPLPIDIQNDMLGKKELTILPSTETYMDKTGTYLTYTQEGMQEFHLEATYDFPQTMLTNLEPNKTGQDVQARLMIQADSLTDWIFHVDMDHFAVTDVPDLKFKVQDAWWDFSDVTNPKVPDPENGLYFKIQSDKSWKGFFAEQIEVEFDNPLNKSSTPTKITAKDLFIDDTGVTVYLRGDQLVDINGGQVGTFNFTLDSLIIQMVSNGFVYGKMGGSVLLNLVDRKQMNGIITLDDDTKQSLIPYSANMTYTGFDNDNDGEDDGKKLTYNFLMHPQGGVSVPIWYAALNLNDNSAIQISNATDTLKASALLHGSIGFSGSVLFVGNVNLIGFTFQGMGLTSSDPYVTMGNFNISLSSPQHSLSDFPVNIDDVKFVTKGALMGFKFSMSLNLADTSMMLPKANTVFTLYGRVINQMGEFEPAYDHAELDSICIDGKLSVLHVKGCVAFFHDDPTFGNGFLGTATVDFPAEIRVGATVQFGNVNQYKYWYADAFITLPEGKGIPMFAGLEAFGFGGGAYYHMKRTPEYPVVNMQQLTTGNAGNVTPGFSGSGISYVPDNSIDLGLKAKLYFATTKRDVFNADVQLQVQFKNGGLDKIWLDGNARFVSDKEMESGNVYGAIHVIYDHENRLFHSAITAQLNVANGSITGGGNLDMHFEQPPGANLKWYVRFGRPQGTNWVNIKFFGVYTIETYFQAGNIEIDPMPEPPDFVLNLVKAEHKQAASARTGMGGDYGFSIIHGGRSTVDIGGQFLMFYGSLKAGFGYDLMLQKLLKGCGGQGNPQQVGLNGWYASGQAYAGIEGEIGIVLSMFGSEGRYQIASIGLGALLQAGFVNPSWVEGKVGGYYALFDSLLVGKFNYEFSAGEKCVPDMPDPLASIKLISDVKPVHNTNNASVTTIPAVATSLKMDKNKTMTMIQRVNNKDVPRMFRFGADLVQLEVRKNGTLMSQSDFIRIVSTDGFGLAYQPKMTFDKETNYQFKVVAQVEECQNPEYNTVTKIAKCTSNVWVKAKLNGVEYKEEQTVAFKTDKGLDSIPSSIVEYTFPYNLSRAFLHQDRETPKIKMSVGFNPNSYKMGPAGVPVTYKARFVPLNNQNNSVSVPATVVTGKNVIEFAWPGALNPATFYAVQLVAEWTQAGKMTGALTTAQASQVRVFENAVVAQVNGRKLITDKLSLPSNATRLYEFRFRTSQYPNLAAKMDAMDYDQICYNAKKNLQSSEEKNVVINDGRNLTPQKIAQQINTALGNPVNAKPVIRYMPYIWMQGAERFDKYDMLGYKRTMPNGTVISKPAFIKFEDQAINKAWFDIKKEMFETLYKGPVKYADVDLRFIFNGPGGAILQHSVSGPHSGLIGWTEALGGPAGEPGSLILFGNQKRTVKFKTEYVGNMPYPQVMNPNPILTQLIPYIPTYNEYMSFLQGLGIAYDIAQNRWNQYINSGGIQPSPVIVNGNLPIGLPGGIQVGGGFGGN